jgi:Fic family protein
MMKVLMKRDDLAHAVRERLQRLPEPFQAHYGVVPLPPPEDTIFLQEARSNHQRSLDMIARVDALAAELHDPYLISRILSRREAVSSSLIEGTNSTLDELLTGEEDDDKVLSAARQVRDYALTLDRFVPQAAAEGSQLFTPELISALHEEAMRHDPDYRDQPGMLRTGVVWIGGGGNIAYSTYNPPPPDEVPTCLAETARYMRCEGMQSVTQSLIVRMAVAHAHFEAVHPFRDGNGRVGRLLLPLMMAADGHIPLYLSPYIEANRIAYYAGLKAAQQSLDYDLMTSFFAGAVIATVEELFATRQALRALAERWKTRRKYRRGSAALRSLEILPDYPVITPKRLAARLGLSIPATLAGIGQLQEVGIMTERTGYKRNRIFAASEVLSVLNRPFGEQPLVEGVANEM